MNKRIEKLAKEAVTCFEQDMSGSMEPVESGDWIRFEDLEKFAQLIVKECAEVIQKEVSMKYKDGVGETEDFMGGHYAGSLLARVKIKQHFGVER